MRRLAVAGAALGLLAAACGGGSSASGAPLIRDAPDKTVGARTSRIELLIERPKGQAATAAFTLRMAGEVDLQARRGHMSFDLTSLGLPGTVDAVFDGTTVYEKLPAALSQSLPGLGASKPWLKINADSAGQSLGVTGLGSAQSGDPSQSLDYLRGVSDDVKRVGTETLRGTRTTHSRVVIDLQKAAAASPKSRRAIESTTKLLGSSKLAADVWVDGQERLRKFRYTIDLSKSRVAASTPGVPSSLTFTLELFDFGVPVQVAVPAPDQVADLSSVSRPGA